MHVPISAYNVFCVAPVTLRWRRGAAAALGRAVRARSSILGRDGQSQG
jgi:hypothetical protein